MKKKFNVVCIIPARKGSKGIKLKNLEKIDNKPLIYYPITAAKKAKLLMIFLFQLIVQKLLMYQKDTAHKCLF